jgi:UDP-N-acetylmuramoyl-tripeptide--D-alanyl-D-alanine ligase
MTLADIARILGCSRSDILWTPDGDAPVFPADIRALPWAERRFAQARIDSRLVARDDLFFCFRGTRADGHDFAPAAAEAGACAIIAERNPFAGRAMPDKAPPVFLVPDAGAALQRLAACRREKSRARVIGVTGSAGKTSVKEVLAQVLALQARTERSFLNQNNGIGLPLNLLNAAEDASFWVMEIGISRPGDMDELAALLRPDLGLVLNAGEAHAEGLGDKGAAHYKAGLFPYVREQGAALYSIDYPDLERAVGEHRAVLKARNITEMTFSAFSERASCRAAYEGFGLRGRYRVFVRGREYSVEAPFRGEMGAENVAAIVAAASCLGLDLETIRRGLAAAVLPEQRFAQVRCGDFLLVDDSYNANPLSARRMLEVAREMALEAALPLILVMGGMEELGTGSAAAHEQLGKRMAGVDPRIVFWKGGHAEAVRKGLAAGGYRGRIIAVADAEAFTAHLGALGFREGLVLFKGSRAHHLEDLVRAFTGIREGE